MPFDPGARRFDAMSALQERNAAKPVNLGGIFKSLGQTFKDESSQAAAGIFRKLKASAIETVSRTPIAQEAKAAEIRKMAPAIIGVAILVLVLGVVLGRRS